MMEKESRPYFIFDLDDTLYDLSASFRKTHEELLGDRMEVPVSELFEASRRYNKEAFGLWSRGLLTKQEEFSYRIRKTYADFGLELSEEELRKFSESYRENQNRITLMDGMEEILIMLRESGAALAVLTNGNHADQWKKLAALGVFRYIPEERVLISEDLPAPKPELAAFRTAEKRLGLGKCGIYYIGDTFEIDIAGAVAAGWNTIWFNHRGRVLPEGGVRPDYTAENVRELRDIFGKILTEAREN